MKAYIKVTLMSFVLLFAATGTFVVNTPDVAANEKPSVCHPVNGLGELKDGWNLISPDKASSHIDESKYPDGQYWKHMSKDGLRHDVYAEIDKDTQKEICPGQVVDEPDYCDPSQRPAGMSIGEWIPEGLKCVDLKVTKQCGLLSATVTKDSSFPYTYVASWSTGEKPDYNYTTALPATFPEDYNGGSVNVWYWLTGPEADYVTGDARSLPNFWNKTALNETVDTDCVEPEEEDDTDGTVLGDTTPTITPQVASVVTTVPASLPMTGASDAKTALTVIAGTVAATAAVAYTLRRRASDLPL